MVRYLPYRWGGRRAERNLLFHLWGHTPGVHALSPFLTINSQTVEPFFRYKGGDASLSGWPAWGYGEDLSYVAGTAPDFNENGPLLGSDDIGLKFNSGGYFYGSGNQIDTEDFVLSVFGQANMLSNYPWMVATRPGGIGYNINFAYSSNSAIYFVIEDSSGDVSLHSSALEHGQFFHSMIFVNRDENSSYGARIYTNGIDDGSANFSTRPGSLVSSNDFYIGTAPSKPGSSGIDKIFFAIGWKASNWLPAGEAGPAEYAVIAAERFYRLTGTWPTKAVGTWAPTVATRAFGAYLENQDAASPYTKRIYQVGSEHLRVQRAMVNGSRFIGYRPEPQTTNLISESEDLATTWAATRCSISQDAIDTPDGDGRTVVDGIIASVDDDTHYVEITPPFADGQPHHISFYAKVGAVDRIKVEFSGGEYAYFDLDLGTEVGYSGLDPSIDKTLADDFCKCIVKLSDLASTDTLRLYPAEAGGDETFAGDGSSVSVYVWGVQVESNSVNATSTINTDGATATRLADQARYKGDDGNIPTGSGRMTMKVLFTDPVTWDGAGVIPLASLSDGGSASDCIDLYVVNSEGMFVVVTSAADGGSAGYASKSAGVADGDVHSIEVRWKTDYLAVAVDGVWSTPDTDVDIPDDLDRIDVGKDHDGSYWSSGVMISDFKIYSWNG